MSDFCPIAAVGKSSTFAEAYIVVSNDLAEESATRHAEAIAEVILRPLGLVEAMGSRAVMRAADWIVTRRNGDAIRPFDTIHRR